YDRHEEAFPCFLNAVGFGGPRFYDYDAALADCCRSLGRIEQATFYFKRAIKTNPDYSDAHNNLAALYLSQKDEEKAFRHFSIAAEQEHAGAMYNLARIHLRRNESDLAISWLENSLATATDAGQLDIVPKIQQKLQSVRSGKDSQQPAEQMP
ncbi:MAG: tetratricopeptide repeat protein, partial [Planctomycetota bacterium]